MRKYGTFVFIAAMTAALLARAEVDKKTERTWKAKCASCHGTDATGNTEQGKKLKVGDYTSADWQAKHTNEELKKGILDGVPGMDGYKDKLSAEEADKLVELIRTLKK